ncbi:MAG TPA: hypothetical protein DEV89_06290 [Erysipelotrichaceae bacterium]|nr:hypothetical protein [Erysipelotrichaceae bacterium]HCG97667.1 hypothetical protein [Erysipelotrichaceae bacterium]
MEAIRSQIRKRGVESMSVKKIVTGKWEVRESVYVEGERRHMKRRFKTRKDAVAFQEKLISEKQSGSLKIKKKIMKII